MAHQINLYNPTLLAPSRRFSARAMAQSLALLSALLVIGGLWMTLSDVKLRRSAQESSQSQAAERERLTQALALRPTLSGSALEQELAQAQQQLARRQQVLDELSGGRMDARHSYSAMLQLVAQTVPAPVWLSSIRMIEGRLDLTGFTLQPEALRPWLGELAQHPLTAAQQLSAVKLERVDAASANAMPSGGAVVWSFHLMSKTPKAGEITP